MSRASTSPRAGAVLALLALATSCTTGDGSGDSEVALRPDRASYLPTALVTLSVPVGVQLSQETYSATLGDAALTVVRVGTTQLGLELPQRAAGEHALKVALDGGRSGTAQLRVDAAPAVADPTAHITETLGASRAATAQSLLSLQGSGLFSGAELSELEARGEALVQHAEALLAQASEAERAEAALFIAANPGLAGETAAAGAGRVGARALRALAEGEEWCVEGVKPQERMDQVFVYVENQLAGVNPVQTYRDVLARSNSHPSALAAAVGNVFAFGRMLNILKEATLGTACAIARFGDLLVAEMDSSASGQAVAVEPSVSAASVSGLAASYTRPTFIKKEPHRIRVLSSYQSLSTSLVPPGSTLAQGLSVLQQLLGWAAERFGVAAFRIELAPAMPRFTSVLPVDASYLTPSLNPVAYAGLTWSYVREGGDFIFTFDAPPLEIWNVAMDLRYAAPRVAEQALGFYGVVRDPPPTIHGTWTVTGIRLRHEHSSPVEVNEFTGPFEPGDTWVINKDGTATLWPAERTSEWSSRNVAAGYTYLFTGPATYTLSVDGATLQFTRASGATSPSLTVKEMDADTLLVRHPTNDHPLDFNEYTFTR